MDVLTETAEETAAFDAMRDEPAAEATPAPEPAAPEPAPAPEPVAAPEPQAPPQGHVPLAALHESRAKQRAAEQEAAGLKAMLARMQQPPAAAQPTVETDPIAVLNNIQQRLNQQDQQTAFVNEAQAVYQRGATQIRQHAQETPDYQDAVAYLEKAVRAEYDAMGIPPEEQEQRGHEQILGTIQYALSRGLNPGKLFYDFAKARGYQGKPPAPIAAPAPAVAPQAIVQQVADGRAAHKSLQGGSEPDAELSIADASKLKGAAFDAWWAKNARRLMN